MAKKAPTLCYEHLYQLVEPVRQAHERYQRFNPVQFTTEDLLRGALPAKHVDTLQYAIDAKLVEADTQTYRDITLSSRDFDDLDLLPTPSVAQPDGAVLQLHSAHVKFRVLRNYHRFPTYCIGGHECSLTPALSQKIAQSLEYYLVGYAGYAAIRVLIRRCHDETVDRLAGTLPELASIIDNGLRGYYEAQSAKNNRLPMVPGVRSLLRAAKTFMATLSLLPDQAQAYPDASMELAGAYLELPTPIDTRFIEPDGTFSPDSCRQSIPS